jgi:hypothetical protein
MRYILLLNTLFMSCIILPKPMPLNFTEHKIVNKDNPVYLFEPCKMRPGEAVCPIDVYRNNLHVVNNTHAELLHLGEDNAHMARSTMAHERADIKRHAIVQDQIYTLQWKIVGWTAGGLVVGLLAGLLAGAL